MAHKFELLLLLGILASCKSMLFHTVSDLVQISGAQGEIILCTDVGSKLLVKNGNIYSFYHDTQPLFAFSSLGEKTPIDILTCKIQQYQRDRLDAF